MSNSLFCRLYFSGLSPLRYIVAFFSVCIICFVLIFTFKAHKPITAPIGWEKTFSITPLRVSVSNYHASSRGNFVGVVFIPVFQFF